MSERKLHVRRTMPPWRRGSPPIAECGMRVEETEKMLAREEYYELPVDASRRGQVCATCASTISRHETWEKHPVGHLIREAGAQFVALGRDCDQLTDEVRALAMLVERHPEEFDEVLRPLRVARRRMDLIEPYRDRVGSRLRVEFLRGRLRFIGPSSTKIGPNERPPFGCVLLIFDGTAEDIHRPSNEAIIGQRQMELAT